MTSARDEIREVISSLLDEGVDARIITQALRQVSPTEMYLERLEEEFVEDVNEHSDWDIFYERMRGPFISPDSVDSGAELIRSIKEWSEEYGYQVHVRRDPRKRYQVQVIGEDDD